MAQPIDVLKQKIAELEANLPELLEKATISVAMDGLAIAQLNIQERGFGEVYLSEEYMDYRAEQGHQTEFVDLTLSGRMWAGMQPSDVINEGWKYYATLTNNNQEGADKMNWNFERYGDFIGKALENDVETLRDVAVETIFNYLDVLGI